MKASGQLFVIAAPSGAGKTSLVTALINQLKNICVSISHTTRPKRSKEQDGVNYFFIDEHEFERMIAENEFLEHAEVFGNLYGTSRQWVLDQLDSGNDVILEIDWQGASQVRKQIPDSRSIFILPPTPYTLRERLERRGQDDQVVISRRLEEASLEMTHFDEFDYLIVNEHFDVALEQLQTIVCAERLRTSRQQKQYHHLIAQLTG